MQPLLIPDVPAALALGSLAAFVGAGALSALLLVLPSLSSEGKRRLLVALGLVLLVAGASVYASEQTVLNPCSQCATAEGWLYWVLGCWACPS